MSFPNASRTTTVAYPHQRQNSNFVEPCDGGSFTALAGAQDKITARLRSKSMANELSRQACDDYQEDIMKHMRQMEVKNLGSLS